MLGFAFGSTQPTYWQPLGSIGGGLLRPGPDVVNLRGSSEGTCRRARQAMYPPVRKRSMPERQLDLFSATGFSPERHPEPKPRPQQPPPADLDDDALIAAIPWAGVADTHSLVAE